MSTGRGLRGGETQALYLMEELAGRGVGQAVVARAGQPLAQRAGALGLEVLPVGGRLGAAAALRSPGGDGKTVAHAHDGHAHTALWLANLGGAGLPFVASRRVHRAPAGAGWAYGKYRHPALRSLLCVSEAVAALHRERLGQKVPVRVVRSAVAAPAAGEGVDLCAELGLPPGTPLVGTVAALAPEKDGVTFVKTCALVARERPGVHFVHVGGGSEAAQRELLVAVEASGLGARFHALGFRADAAALIGGLDVFLFTSRWEGLGGAVLQAQVRRVPVVSTAAGGLAEVVRDGVTGRTGPVGAPEGLAKAVLGLLADDAAAARLTAAAYEQAAGYSVGAMTDGTLAAYAAALASGASGAT